MSPRAARNPTAHGARARSRGAPSASDPRQLGLDHLAAWDLPPDRYGRTRVISEFHPAGPIAGKTYADAANWRTFVAAWLAARSPHIRCLDPMRGKDDKGVMKPAGGSAIMDARSVVARDLWDIKRADVVLMYLGDAEDVSVGEDDRARPRCRTR